MANDAATSSDLSGKTVAGRYKVMKQLGEGGQSQVYVAVQEPLGRKVALKVIRGEMASDPDQIARFETEARTISELQHPHIIPIYDFGRDGDMLFMVMELVKGRSLGKRLAEGTPLSLTSSIQIVRDVSNGLEAAHKRGVVHRDLKPDNIMLVTDTGRPDYAKILDFGIAKRQSEMKNVTMQGMIVGTPGYLAPEVATGIPFDGRADLYALGVIWYEMLTGQPMFTALTPIALVMKHATDAPAPFTSIGVEVPHEIEQLIFSLIEKNPELRPASAQALVNKLDSLGFTTSAGMAMPTRSAAAPAPVDAAAAGMAHSATTKLGTIPGASSTGQWPGNAASSSSSPPPQPSSQPPPQPSSPPPQPSSSSSSSADAPAFSQDPHAPAFHASSPASSASAASASASAAASAFPPGSTAPDAPAFNKAPEAAAFGPGGVAFQQPPAATSKPKSGMGCLKMGCIAAVIVVALGVVITLWAGNWAQHLMKKPDKKPTITQPARPVAPQPTRPTTPTRPPATPTRPPAPTAPRPR